MLKKKLKIGTQGLRTEKHMPSLNTFFFCQVIKFKKCSIDLKSWNDNRHKNKVKSTDMTKKEF